MKLIKKKEKSKQDILAEYRKAYLEYKASQDKFMLNTGVITSAFMLLIYLFKYNDNFVPEIFMLSISPLITGIVFHYVPKFYWTRKYNKLENIVKDYTYTFTIPKSFLEERSVVGHNDSKIEDLKRNEKI